MGPNWKSIRFRPPSVHKMKNILRSRAAISIFKGVLAYVLGFVLLFIGAFDRLQTYPATLTSMILFTIAGGVSKSIGACLDTTFLGLIGVGTGSVAFVILAKLAPAPVAQGFVFIM